MDVGLEGRQDLKRFWGSAVGDQGARADDLDRRGGTTPGVDATTAVAAPQAPVPSALYAAAPRTRIASSGAPPRE